MPATHLKTVYGSSPIVVRPRAFHADGSNPYCRHCGARFFREEHPAASTRQCLCCANGKCIIPTPPEVATALRQLYEQLEWPRLSKSVNECCNFTCTAVSRFGVEGDRGLHFPHNPPCSVKFEGQIAFLPQQLAGSPCMRQSAAGQVAQASHAWYLRGPWTPPHLTPHIATLSSKLRSSLLVHHPGTTLSVLRTAEDELHVEFEKPLDTDEVVALYQCPIRQLLRFSNSTTPTPALHRSLYRQGNLTVSVFWPDGFVPYSSSSSDTRLKWIRGLLFKQLPRFPMSTTLFQTYCLTL